MWSTPDIEEFADAGELARAAAASIADQLRVGLGERPRATLCATGGRSPGLVYDRLAEADLDWNRVVLTLSDERCVGPDDPASNLRLVRDRLTQDRAKRAHVTPLWPRPPSAAIRALLPFDAVMLGMGEDGHVASLIPGSPTLHEGLRSEGGELIVETPAGLGDPPLARISLTLTALSQARAIFLLVAGAAKREVLARAAAGEALPVRALLEQRRAPVRIMWSPERGASS